MEYTLSEPVWVVVRNGQRRAGVIIEVLGDDEYRVRYLSGGMMVWDNRWLLPRKKSQTVWGSSHEADDAA